MEAEMADEKKTIVPGGGEVPKPKSGEEKGLPALIQQFARGEVDAQTVASSIRTEDPDRPAGDLTFEQKEKRAMEDDYGDYRGSFSEVVAAWIGGTITDAQYNEIREAFTPEGAATGEESDAATEEEAPEAGAETPAPAPSEQPPAK